MQIKSININRENTNKQVRKQSFSSNVITKKIYTPFKQIKADTVTFSSKSTISFGEKTEYNTEATERLRALYDDNKYMDNPQTTREFCQKAREEIENGADPNIKVSDKPLLCHIAEHYDAPALIKLCVEHGADVNARMNWSAITYAIYHDRAENVKMLLQLGANYPESFYGDHLTNNVKYKRINDRIKLQEQQKVIYETIFNSFKTNGKQDYEVFSDLNFYLRILNSKDLTEKFKESLFNGNAAFIGQSLLLQLLQYTDPHYPDAGQPKEKYQAEYQKLLQKLSEFKIDYTQRHEMFGSVFEMILDNNSTGMLKLLAKSGQKTEYEKIFDQKYETIWDKDFKTELDKVRTELISFPDVDKAYNSGNTEAQSAVAQQKQSPFYKPIKATVETAENNEETVNPAQSLNTRKYNEEATLKLYAICDNFDYDSIAPQPWLVTKWFCHDVKKQIKQGANPNINIAGSQVLDMILMCCDSPDTIKCLLQHGADATYENFLGYSALEFAKYNHREKSAEVLQRWQRFHGVDLL